MRGGLTVSKRRHRLNDKSTRCATVLGAWANHGGLLLETEILMAIKAKKSRSKQPQVGDVDKEIPIE